MSIDIKDLVKARVHFGHRTTKWNPRMAPFIWGTKNNIHLINVSKTAVLLERAAQFLESVAAEGKTILWVGTKKASTSKDSTEVAKSLESPYVPQPVIGEFALAGGEARRQHLRLVVKLDAQDRAGISFDERLPHPLQIGTEIRVIQQEFVHYLDGRRRVAQNQWRGPERFQQILELNQHGFVFRQRNQIQRGSENHA